MSVFTRKVRVKGRNGEIELLYEDNETTVGTVKFDMQHVIELLSSAVAAHDALGKKGQ